MKKNMLFTLSLPLLLTSILAGCGGKNNSSSDEQVDTRTVQEKVLASFEDEIAVTGDYTLGQVMSFPNYETGEMMTMDMPMGTSTYTTYSCPDYTYIRQDIEDPEYHYDVRIDKDGLGKASLYKVDPFENRVLPTAWGGTFVDYDELFGNPFVTPNDFEISESKLVLKAENSFSFKKLGNILALGNRATTIRSLEIGFDENNNPTTLHANFVDETNSAGGMEAYWIYEGRFVAPNTVNVAPIPTPVPAQAGQDTLEAKLASLRASNFTATTTIYDGANKVTDVTVSVNPTHVYFDFENTDPEYSYMNFVDRGYFQDENGLNYYKMKDGVPTATSYPGTRQTIQDILSRIFKISGNVFNVNEDGTYTLPNYEFSVSVNDYLGPESLYAPGISVDKGTFNVALTSSGISYTYTNDAQYRVETTVSEIGTTTMPVDLTTFVPYAPSTDLLFWGQNQMLPDWSFVMNNITGDHPELIPFYEGNGLNDGYVDINDHFDPETGTLYHFSAGFDIAQECSNAEEEMELFMHFDEEIHKREGYSYKFMDDLYEYGSEGDDVHFTVQISFGQYMNIYTGNVLPHAVTLKVRNLATPEGWSNSFEDL